MHDGGMCQNSLLLIMEDGRSESIFLGVSLCGLVSKCSVWLYGRTERSIKAAISSDEQNHITTGCYTVVIHETQAAYRCKSINLFPCLLGNKNLFHGFIGPSSHKVLRFFN